MIPFLNLSEQYKSIKKEIDDAIKQVLESTSFVGGKFLLAFEKKFSNYNGLNHCIGVANGTDALEIAINALNLPKGAEIIVPVNTFVACAEAVVRSGYRIVFCDCNKDNYTLSVASMQKKITKNTAAIMAVHLYGNICDMKAIRKIALTHKLKVIEDCSQAHGSKYEGVNVGSFGDIACFSFYPSKTLGAYGDGGAILTNSNKLAKICRQLSNHGGLKKYQHEIIGRNSRLDDIQAAILSVKLDYLDKWIDLREKLIAKYTSLLKENKAVILAKNGKKNKISHYLMVIRVKKRANLIKKLKENGVQTLIHYPKIITKLPAFKNHHQQSEHFIAEEISEYLLSLPLNEYLSDNQIIKICYIINKFNFKV